MRFNSMFLQKNTKVVRKIFAPPKPGIAGGPADCSQTYPQAFGVPSSELAQALGAWFCRNREISRPSGRLLTICCSAPSGKPAFCLGLRAGPTTIGSFSRFRPPVKDFL